MSKTLIFKPNRLLIWHYIPLLIFFGLLATRSLMLDPFLSVIGYSYLVIFFLVLVSAFIDNRRLRLEQYIISDHSIQIQTHSDDSTISLVNITMVKGIPYLLLRYKKLGIIEITANGQQYKMRGIEDASSTAAIIWQAVEAAIARQNKQNRPAFFQPPTHAAGTLEQMNDLVGLWQQGMISDEEYQNETKRLTANQ